jgi:hypothetical protein
VTKGIVYMAYGNNAGAEAERSIVSLEQHCGLPTFVVDEVSRQNCHGAPPEGYGAGQWMFLPGLVKPFLYDLSPFTQTLYLDVDTRVMADPSPLFDLLDAGWDMALVPGQAAKFVRDTDFAPRELDVTLTELGTGLLFYYNSGVILWRKNDRVQEFFQAWHDEWQRFRNWDEQMALMRALWRTDIRFMTLPTCWNSRERNGAMIYHDTGNKRAW